MEKQIPWVSTEGRVVDIVGKCPEATPVPQRVLDEYQKMLESMKEQSNRPESIVIDSV